MKTIPLGASGLSVPAIAVGCMRITGLSEQELDRHLLNCMAEGLNFFDHADIYGAGRCEEVFAASVKRTGLRREGMFLQSKCGIRPGMYDFSREHILSSVDGILKRLDTDYLDMLLLHRPDALMEPEEVAEAFDTLNAAARSAISAFPTTGPPRLSCSRSVSVSRFAWISSSSVCPNPVWYPPAWR